MTFRSDFAKLTGARRRVFGLHQLWGVEQERKGQGS